MPDSLSTAVDSRSATTRAATHADAPPAAQPSTPRQRRGRTTDLDRMYARYASTHAGTGGAEATRLLFGRDIAAHLPADRRASILDLGCGQGHLVAEMQRHGYRHARGVDVSAEQVSIARHNGVTGVEQRDIRTALETSPEGFQVITALDVLEHLVRQEVLDILDLAAIALHPGGTLIARVPNAASPLGGGVVFGDLTHETFFTPGSFRQALVTTGFTNVQIYPCRPVVHGAASAARWLIWQGVSGLITLALAAEGGYRHGRIVTRNILAVAHAPQ
ncbi:O-antigen chain-terminating methyltransferase [Frankia sp. Hr75.2]|uniref:class I SAM-dependent methyltransferase n=1 Tax=Parafrankia sp. Ea1.12 TaxID=573499 RepID=UPI000DA5D18D|nr:class I SAM-dependent methyltransferase [Parafrankia sp. Ea1.12]CAI7976889.1 O-antigen chain-terminating methyltransferase [Frankia sp. Hr75.2]SQD97040.1 Methyltransferase type 12 [Parafrankia sp. Ea1.12]